jgi:hypothetical protein
MAIIFKEVCYVAPEKSQNNKSATLKLVKVTVKAKIQYKCVDNFVIQL